MEAWSCSAVPSDSLSSTIHWLIKFRFRIIYIHILMARRHQQTNVGKEVNPKISFQLFRSLTRRINEKPKLILHRNKTTWKLIWIWLFKTLSNFSHLSKRIMEIWWLFMGSTANPRKRTSLCGPDRAHEVFCRKRSTQENLKQRMVEYLCTELIFSGSCSQKWLLVVWR